MKRFSGVSALALCALTTPAMADVTPQMVWDDLETYMQGFGYSVSGTQTSSGADLTVNDVEMSVPIPDVDGTMTFSLETMTLVDQGDGTVAVSLPSAMPVRIQGVDGDDEIDVTVNLGQQGFALSVSGEPGDLTYDYTAEKMTVALGKMMSDGREITPDMLRVDMESGPISGQSIVQRGEGMQTVTVDVASDQITYDVAFNDPDSSEAGLFNGAMAGVFTAGTWTVPEGADYSDPVAVMEAGFELDFKLGHTGGNMEFAVTEDSGTTHGRTSSDRGEAVVAMDKGTFTYELRGTGNKFEFSGPEVPMPVSAEFAEAGFALSMPMQPADAPQEASFELTFNDFKMAEMLWNTFDPAANLPRDPATLRLVLEATVSPFVNFFDQSALDEIDSEGGVPGELNTMSLREILINAVGAKIAGSGDFTFDNSDLESFDGMPRPEGKLDLAISGANGLIDKLIAMGLMGDEDAMGARMMMGMFMVPGNEPDTATSVIEVNAEGHVLANGQRLK